MPKTFLLRRHKLVPEDTPTENDQEQNNCMIQSGGTESVFAELDQIEFPSKASTELQANLQPTSDGNKSDDILQLLHCKFGDWYHPQNHVQVQSTNPVKYAPNTVASNPAKYMHNTISLNPIIHSISRNFCLQFLHSNVTEPARSDATPSCICKRSGNSRKESASPCDHCDKNFAPKFTMLTSEKLSNSHSVKPFVCPTCGKGFRLSSTLCRHKIIHTTQRPHKCYVCLKSFNRSSTLKTHLRTHSSVKEYTCNVCGKGFHQKGNLRNHVLIHTGEKPWTCDICKKKFNKLSNLKFHMHSHTDQKPYRCRFCKQAMTRRGELKQHIAQYHQHNN